MEYLICIKNSDNISGSLYRIAENESDLNNLNIKIDDYKIIEISQNDFNLIKLGNKFFDYDSGLVLRLEKLQDIFLNPLE
jgi:hypothetical protein